MTDERRPFPAVTICSLNPLQQDKAKKVPILAQLLNACDAPPPKAASTGQSAAKKTTPQPKQAKCIKPEMDKDTKMIKT